MTPPATTPMPTRPVHRAAARPELLRVDIRVDVLVGAAVASSGQSDVQGSAVVKGVGARLPVLVAPVGVKAGSCVPRLGSGREGAEGLRTISTVSNRDTRQKLDEAHRCR